ncbi:ABC transporter permease [Pseudonocardia thermophila]|jgi:ABC-type proline/glycine betaine transport systems, permease component|uniref:ABC transporter permease n=1 Tax=Pseudonocardia thermophila TaxID=1848 RepID=UPI00248DAA69|nr:ABC transporter permease [Pseudonocardia thermophila]
MTWVLANLDRLLSLTLEHLYFSVIPVVLGLVLAIPIGWAAGLRPAVRAVLVNVSGLLYTVPSIALFVLMPVVLGTQIRSQVNVFAALTIYTLALLVRTVADGLSAVPSGVVDAATAMGYGRVRRFLEVELPLAVPVIVAGLRVAAASTVSLVTVAALVGFANLGSLFTDGFQRDIPQSVVAGIVLVLLVALVLDRIIVYVGRLLTPWTRVTSRPARVVARPASPEVAP